MHIFVTGSDGFIGSELINHLNGKYKIVSYSHKNGNDILDFRRMKNAMKGCDTVVHLAAIRKPFEDKAFRDYFDVNCTGTFNVAQAALENKVRRFIFVSSMTYYGIEKSFPAIKVPITEFSPVLTQSKTLGKKSLADSDVAYSTSKVIAEQILANYGLTDKMQVVILRFGPTRKRGEYRPFGELKLHLKIENALQAIELAIKTRKKLSYEVFSITDSIKSVDISKARRILGYRPR